MKSVKKLLGCHQKFFLKKLETLPDNLGSWFSVYNLMLSQVDEICKKVLERRRKNLK
jgi:hypothetical protein